MCLSVWTWQVTASLDFSPAGSLVGESICDGILYDRRAIRRQSIVKCLSPSQDRIRELDLELDPVFQRFTCTANIYCRMAHAAQYHLK